MHYQNPGHYAVRKVISKDHIEKHMQGTETVYLQNYQGISSPLYLYLSFDYQCCFPSDVCVKKVNELSHHQMIWTDKDGFLLKPLGINTMNP